MDYSRGSIITLGSSTSLVHRNLCVSRDLQTENSITYGVAHKGTASIVHIAAGASTQEEVNYEPTKDRDPMAYITQVGRLSIQFLCYSIVVGIY